MSRYNADDIYAKKAGDDDDWETVRSERLAELFFFLLRLDRTATTSTT